jgi:hypothetical protein
MSKGTLPAWWRYAKTYNSIEQVEGSCHPGELRITLVQNQDGLVTGHLMSEKTLGTSTVFLRVPQAARLTDLCHLWCYLSQGYSCPQGEKEDS